MHILHVSPHPDDEMLGSPATLSLLGEAGHHVFNLALSLGRKEQEERRRAELEEACRRMDWELIIPSYLPSLRGPAEEELQKIVEMYSGRADIVISPSPADGHPAHEVVGRAVGRARPGVWWQWGLWADLPEPTLFVPFREETMEKISYGLAAHEGELRRNDYSRMLRGRAEMNSVLGPERVWGWGTGGVSGHFAEVLREFVWQDQFVSGKKRILDPVAPLG